VRRRRDAAARSGSISELALAAQRRREIEPRERLTRTIRIALIVATSTIAIVAISTPTGSVVVDPSLSLTPGVFTETSPALEMLGPYSSELSVSVSLHPSRAPAGTPITFTLTMIDEHALGAFGYLVKFGDGEIRTIPVPQYCLAPPGRPAHAAWRFTHRYSKPGRYRVSVRAYVNCTSASVTKVSTLVIT
jgi:hypothetical protein